MSKTREAYRNPSNMEPLFPDDKSGNLEGLAVELMKKAFRLSEKLHPTTRIAIAELLRPMNSYYSNLIEGHDTHPIDIERALNKDYSKDKKKRHLQKEAHAHINVHRLICTELDSSDDTLFKTSSKAFLKKIHKNFYQHLPKDFKIVRSIEGEMKDVNPGEFRTSEVEVGEHVAPFAESLNSFIIRFEEFYDPSHISNKNQIRRIISIAAAHHRLAWIHPFLDGNGRVVRLFSDACFINEDLHASGLWSISRGLARSNQKYKTKLANADKRRFDDYDGRGNLSNKMLVEFCTFFLEVAIDQVNFMSSIIDIDNILSRIEGLTQLLILKNKARPESKYILTDVFLKGKISKKEAMRITNTSDKTVKNITDKLLDLKLLNTAREGKDLLYLPNYPIAYSASLFPGLYPSSKEIDLLNNI